eukprot:TRINITY_DN8236_c0_g1_i2.p2 TRINITY_DN8236_c0_g1~~TRINITY_DN8236_c0_g1_i2.p2  ORF type:complete len:155 (+),score=26.51 TRINITY_DN8236_c0_g1_i2:688-1152(+)
MGFFVPSDVKWSENLLEEEINFLCSLPYTVSVPQFGVIVVHAGLIPGIPLDQQHRSVMYKIRNLVVVKDEENPETKFLGIEKNDFGLPWASVWSGPEHVVFGHDASRRLQEYPHATGIDTGCCYGGQLTALVLPGQHRVAVEAAKTYSPIVKKW